MTYLLTNTIDYDELYDVLVDDLVIMKVGNNAIGQADIKSGKHVLQVKSKDYVSNKIKFNIGDGEILEYLVEPDYLDNKFSKVVSHFFASSFKPLMIPSAGFS